MPPMRKPRIAIYDRADRLRDLRKLLRENPRDVAARLQLADALESMGKKRQARLQRIKASQADRFDPDFDYSTPEVNYSLGGPAESILWGEAVRVRGEGFEDVFPADAAQRACEAARVGESGAEILFDDSHYPLLPQELLRRLYEMGTPGEGTEARAAGEEGFSVSLDAESGMYTLVWPRGES